MAHVSVARVICNPRTSRGANPTGGVASLAIYFGPQSIQPGLITDLRRDGDRLRFRFWDAWLGCARPFQSDLTLVP